jgi:undecaprenyl-diphosphatase
MRAWLSACMGRGVNSTNADSSRAKVPRATPLVLAAGLAGGMAMLARSIGIDGPFAVDHAVRGQVHRCVPQRTRAVLAPLFIVGLPGGYITIAYGAAWWLRRRGRAGGPAIVTSAWLGWLVHRGVKLVYRRERPRIPRVRRRMDSYPSGHTTGATALAVTTALVLRRNGLVSPASAAAIAVGAPLVMGAYRVIDDEHWATDVLGGWLLGSSIALVSDAVLGSARGPAIRRGRRTAAGRAARA